MTSTIAFQGPLSGTFGWVGENLVRAAELALPEDGSIVLAPYDSGGKPDRAQAVAERIAADAAVIAVIGPTFSREAEASAPVFEEADLPFVLPVATKPELGEHGWDHYFRLIASDATRAPLTTRFMRNDLGTRRVAVVSDNSQSGRRVAALVAAALPAAGVEVVLGAEVERGVSSVAVTVDAIASAGSDGVFFGGEYAEAALLRRGLVDRDSAIEFVSDDGVLTPSFVESAGAAAEGTWVTFPGAGKEVAGEPFVSEFPRRYRHEPGAFAVEAYQAASLLVGAAGEAGAERAAVTEYMRAYDGVTAGRKIAFTAEGENRYQTFFAYQVVGGTWRQRHELVIADTVES
jgi:branched-chain amino acid transport system substrate-binding protein